MITLTTRKASLKDIKYIASRLREADLAEVAASTGETATTALTHGYEISTICNTVVTSTGVPVAIYGVLDTGGVWMLGTDDMKKYARSFLKQCTGIIDDLNKQFPLLYSYVDARNTLHIRWLKWVGFNFIARHENYGNEQRLFYEIVRINDGSNYNVLDFDGYHSSDNSSFHECCTI